MVHALVVGDDFDPTDSPWLTGLVASEEATETPAGIVLGKTQPAVRTNSPERPGLILNARQNPEMADSFPDVFAALRTILERNIGKLIVSEDSPTRYCLQGGLHPKHKTPMPIAWVEIGKSYVSFHHMGVYARPDLLKGISKKLKARMQGKSCFNFTSVDEPLFAELENLTMRTFEAFRKSPFMQ